MEVDQDEDLLRTLAAGLPMDFAQWPTLLADIISRLDKIARHDFPIPNLPPPPRPVNPPGNAIPSSVEAVNSQPSSQEADKENNQPAPEPQAQNQPQAEPAPPAEPGAADAPAPPPQPLAPGQLPPQIEDMLTEIATVLRDGFPKHPPHTIQRLAELILAPRAHYRHLAPYLHAVDRVVHVTSINSLYPLPPAIPDMSTMTLLSNGVSPDSARNAPEKDPAAAVAWSNPTNTVGSDEALGGALLTPIPWLTRRPSPHAGSASSSPGSRSPQHGHQHEIRTESTETIDGPNGIGSVETVTVNLNGLSPMTAGSAAAIAAQQQAQREAQAAAAAIAAGNTGSRPITQDEVASHHTQNAAAQVAAAQAAAVAAAVGRSGPGASRASTREGEGEAADAQDGVAEINGEAEAGVAASSSEDAAPQADEDEDEVPHVRGPEEIGVDDLGPQSKTTMTLIDAGPGAEMHGIDVEAAVGRKSDKTNEEEQAAAAAAAAVEGAEEAPDTADHETASDAGSETSTKRDAGGELPDGAPPVKRARASMSPEKQDVVMRERPEDGKEA